MTRVVTTFAFFTLVYPLAALLARDTLGFRGTLAVAGVTTLAMLVCGVPAFLLFLRRGWLDWWQFGLGGALVGLLCTRLAGIALIGFGIKLALSNR